MYETNSANVSFALAKVSKTIAKPQQKIATDTNTNTNTDTDTDTDTDTSPPTPSQEGVDARFEEF